MGIKFNSLAAPLQVRSEPASPGTRRVYAAAADRIAAGSAVGRLPNRNPALVREPLVSAYAPTMPDRDTIRIDVP